MTKRKLEMKRLDAYEVPVGSILENYVESTTSSSQKQEVEVIGVGGKVRHAGEFSANNPYLSQMQLASRNQDKDALYELAVKWEADNYATQENREYNSPIEQVARNRAAGINSDISGSSSGGSSSGGSSSAPIPQQTNTTKFSNSYDNTAQVLSTINTSISLAGAIASLPGTIASSVYAIGTLPEQFANARNQSQILANERTLSDETLSDKVNISHNASSASTFDNLFSLSPSVAEMTDEESLSFLSALGYGADVLPFVKKLNESPELYSKIQAHRRQSRNDSAYLQEYTAEMLSNIMSFNAQADFFQSQGRMYTEDFQSSVARLLNTDDNVENTANMSKKTTDLSLQRVKRDSQAFTYNLKSIAKAVKDLDDEYAYKKEIFKATNGGVSPNEQAILDSYLLRKSNLESLGSSQLSAYLNIIRDVYHQEYTLSKMYDYATEVISTDNIGSIYSTFTDLTFGKLISGTTSWETYNNANLAFYQLLETMRNNRFNNGLGVANAIIPW